MRVPGAPGTKGAERVISVGLELAGNAIKVAVLEEGRGGPKLKAFEVRKIDAKKGEVEDDIVSVVDETLKRLKVPRNTVVCSVRALDCMIREIVVPFTDDDKIRKTIKYQAENYFTSLSIDDLIIEYTKFSEVETKAKLMVAGIKKSHVDRRLRFLEECGVDPLAIDLDVAALFNAYMHVGALEGKGAALLVDIEADTLKLGVVEDGKLRLARAIRMRVGSMRLDGPKPGGRAARLSGESGIHDTAADESARLPVVILDEADDEAFSLEDSGITESEREGILHRVFMEIDRTVAAVQLSHEVEVICLTGASCVLDGIEEVFTEHFEIEATRIDVAGPLGGPADKNVKGEASVSLDGVAAIGLALKGLGIDHAGMDFRQEEFVYRGTFDQLKRGLACTLTLLFALVFLYAFNLKQELREAKNSLLGVKTMQKNLYTVLFPSVEDPAAEHKPLPSGGDAYFEALKSEKQRLANKYGGGSSGGDGQQIGALEILRQFALAKAKVQAHWGIQVEKVRIDPRPTSQSSFVCTCADAAGAIELARKFADHPLLTGDARETRQDPKTNRSIFEFVVKQRDGGRP